MEEWESKVLLLWAKQHSEQFSPLCGNILREICSYLNRWNSLVWVFDQSFSFFDVTTFTMQPAIELNSLVAYDANSRWTAVDAQRVLLCGGGIGGEV